MKAPTPKLGKEHPRRVATEISGLSEPDLDPKLPVQEVSVGIGFLFVPLRSLAALGRAELDSEALERLLGSTEHSIGVYLFCRESREPGHDLAARMLFEAHGVKEDPATGSATAGLGGYLLHHRVLGEGAIDVQVEQGYEMGRPSLLSLRAGLETGVEVGGRVIPVARGTLEP